jgi:hypothetical protein
VESADQAESYWLMKEEDPTGATVAGSAHSSSVDPPTVCDPLLTPPNGDVPALGNPATDFDMSGIVFTDSTPYPFPGM